ncbi:helix-turn-helix domain-containing protein [Chloroflexota bacterium]
MYSVREAAQKLGISDRRVRKLLEQGRIKGKKLARDWVVLDLSYTRKRKPKGVKIPTGYGGNHEKPSLRI